MDHMQLRDCMCVCLDVCECGGEEGPKCRVVLFEYEVAQSGEVHTKKRATSQSSGPLHINIHIKELSVLQK